MNKSTYTPKQNRKRGDTPCRYGKGCTRDDCMFNHENVEQKKPHTKREFDPNYKREEMPCRYANKCHRTDCWFKHDTPNGKSPAYCEQDNTSDVKIEQMDKELESMDDAADPDDETSD